jgi:hypothetical protein
VLSSTYTIKVQFAKGERNFQKGHISDGKVLNEEKNFLK